MNNYSAVELRKKLLRLVWLETSAAECVRRPLLLESTLALLESEEEKELFGKLLRRALDDRLQWVKPALRARPSGKHTWSGYGRPDRIEQLRVVKALK